MVEQKFHYGQDTDIQILRPFKNTICDTFLSLMSWVRVFTGANHVKLNDQFNLTYLSPCLSQGLKLGSWCKD